MSSAIYPSLKDKRVVVTGGASGVVAAIVDRQSLKSRIEPGHVASLVLFLASDDGRICTGHEYRIDAGWR